MNKNVIKDSYRVQDISIHQVEEDKILVYFNFSQNSKLLNTSELALLLSCQEFKTLKTHAEDYYFKNKQQFLANREGLLGRVFQWLQDYISEGDIVLPVTRKEMAPYLKKLEMWSNEGLLISESALQHEIRVLSQQIQHNESISNNISIVGIPTCGRTEILKQSLKSFTNNFVQHSRSPDIFIVDDSKGEENKSIIRKQRESYIGNIHHISRKMRKKLAQTIAKKADIDTEIVEFALLGDPRCDFKAGASRNTMLLLASGKQSIQVDDDMLCHIMTSPEIDTGIVLSSETLCNEYWFSNIQEDMITDQGLYEEVDFLGLHETLLGKHPSIELKNHEEIDINNLGARLLDNMNEKKSHIAVTYSGVRGDSGIYWHWQRLLFEGDSYNRLVKDRSNYRKKMSNRELVRSVNQPTIGDGPFCMAGNIGLDTHKLLPPFSPIQRNEDGIFGRLLYLCFRQASRGYLPYTILHDPPGRPTRIDPSEVLQVGPLRTNEIIGAILWSKRQWPFGLDPSRNLYILGQYLNDLSQLPFLQFKTKLRRICWDSIRMRINYFRQYIDEKVNAPAYWQKDVRQVLTNFQELMLREDLNVPHDLPGNASEKLTLFQKLVEKFGKVLINWPAIWETTLRIREKKKIDASWSRNS